MNRFLNKKENDKILAVNSNLIASIFLTIMKKRKLKINQIEDVLKKIRHFWLINPATKKFKDKSKYNRRKESRIKEEDIDSKPIY